MCYCLLHTKQTANILEGLRTKKAACTCDNVNVSYVRQSTVSQFVLRAVQHSHEISSVVSVHLCTSSDDRTGASNICM